MITVWQTSRGWNRQVTEAVLRGLDAAGIPAEARPVHEYAEKPTPSISYGVLHGTGEIFKDCTAAGLPWWCVDHGYFHSKGPSGTHKDGYWRFGFQHLQPTLGHVPGIDGLTAAARWDALGLQPQPWRRNPGGVMVLCPPSPTMAAYYNVDPEGWVETVLAGLPPELRKQAIIRRPEQKYAPNAPKAAALLADARAVVVFNSNLAFEALLAGIPAYATEGLVRSWNRLDPLEWAGQPPEAYEYNNREVLFLHAASYQFTREEISAGLPWQLCRWETPPERPPAGAPIPVEVLAEPVTASLASIPARAAHLQKVVASLLPQVDKLNVYLNGYPKLPEFLNHPKIETVNDRGGALGDAAKFHWEGSGAQGYRLTCDDDLVYAPDYVRFMVAAIERYKRRAVVSLHGSVLTWPITSYYRCRRRLLHCGGVVPEDTTVHAGGTGVMAWHAGTLTVGQEAFEKPNMADIWFAVLARQQGVPIIVPAHGKDRVEILPCEDTIYSRMIGNDRTMAEPLQAWEPWEPLAAGSIAAEAGVQLSVNGTAFRLLYTRPWDRMCRWARETGQFWEQPLLAEIAARAPKGAYFDIGANVGNHAVYFAGVCKAEMVVAVEPNPETYAVLVENIDKNDFGGRIMPVRGIAGAPGKRARLETPDPTNLAMCRAVAAWEGEECITVDGLAAQVKGPVGLIKIDVEGFELEVLLGALEVLKRDKPLLAIEAVDEKAFAAQQKFLLPLGYTPIISFGVSPPVWLWEAQNKESP